MTFLPPPADVGLVHAPQSPLVDLARICRRIARSDATVLLTGETGTGKEVFARLIHASSPRAAKTLVPVNCGAIPEALLESELFGYVRGAFTGATTARKGRIAAAEGGTLFLDEIGELPLSLQVKLLRVLQERTYEPVGSAEPVAADFRLVAATHRDLAAEVEAGRFRQDLYFRLLVCPVELPPLRDRTGDVPHLFRHFWRKRGESRPVDAAVLAALGAWRWPGNIRELENLVERLSVCVEGPRIRLEDLPAQMREGVIAVRAVAEAAAVVEEADRPMPVSSQEVLADLPTPVPAEAVADEAPAPAATPPFEPATAPGEAMVPAPHEEAPAPDDAGAEPPLVPARLTLPIDLPRLLRELEERFIEKALDATDGNKRAAAELLGLQRTTLVEKLRRRQGNPSVA